MNRIILFIVLLLLIGTIPIQSQNIKGAVIFGGNLSQVHGDDFPGWRRIGFNVGAAAIIPLSNKWSVSIENLFTQKGSFQKEQYPPLLPDDTITGEYNLRLNYVEIPILAHYTDKSNLTFGVGLSYSRLVSFKEVEQGGRVLSYSDLGHAFNDSDYSCLLDVRYRFWKKFVANVRFSFSMFKIREREFIDGYGKPFVFTQSNRTFSFRLIYVFNDRLENKRIEE